MHDVVDMDKRIGASDGKHAFASGIGIWGDGARTIHAVREGVEVAGETQASAGDTPSHAPDIVNLHPASSSRFLSPQYSAALPPFPIQLARIRLPWLCICAYVAEE